MDGLAKNSIHTATIEAYTSEGLGIARVNGMAVFVKGAIRGEKCEIKIIKCLKNAAFARLERVIEPSAHRIAPECPAFGKCGGCDFLHMDYAEELALKRQRVLDALRRIGGVEIDDLEIFGAENETNYRNKTIYNVGTKDGKTVTGFFRRRSHDIVDITSCLIQRPEADAAAAAVRRWMDEYKIPAYDEQTFKGAVRHVYVRVSAKGEILLTVVSAENRLKHTEELVSIVREECPQTVGIVLNVNKTRGNTVLAGEFRTLWGADALEDTLCGLKFSLSPRSFYQINRDQAERLYNKALDYAELRGSELALDLYCGTGTITLCLSKRAGEVIGAEIVEQAIIDARENAKRNGAENAKFICADSSEAAKELEKQGTKPDVIVVDPPRKGLSPDVIESIASMSPDRVVYVSCDCATLARDVKLFGALGYEFCKATAVDMFPRTAHVETVCLLSRSK